MAFIKNPNFDPNDPNSKRFIQEELGSPAGTVTVVDPFATNDTKVEIVDPSLPVPDVTVIQPPQPAVGVGGVIPAPVPAPAPQKQIFRVGSDIFDATTKRKLGGEEFLRDFAGKATEVDAPTDFLQPDSQKKIFRKGADIFDASTGRLLGAEEFKRDFAGRALEVIAPIEARGEIRVDRLADRGALEGEVISDTRGLSELVAQAGRAGLSLEDTMSLITAQTGVTTAEKEEIRNKLGIPGLISEQFQPPSETTQEIYTKAFNESGLPKIKGQISDLDEQAKTIRDQASQAITNERKDPFISQATRTGRLRIIQQDAEQKLANLNAQRGQLLGIYDRGLDEIEGVISRFTGQLEADKAMSVEKLNFLLDEAERQAGELAETRGREALRFVPEFLEARLEPDPFSKEALDIQLKLLDIEKKRQDLAGVIDPFEKRKKELELEKLEADVAKAKGEAKPPSPVESVNFENKIKLIDDLLASKGLNSVVGTTVLGRIPLADRLTGASQRFVGGVKQLVSQETIDTLVQLKARGGTLGALSDQERVLLQNAATKIGGWEIKDDKGFGTGRYNIDEPAFKAELQKIKDSTVRLFNAAKVDEQAVAPQKSDYDSIGFDISYEEALQTYGEAGLSQIIESQKKNDKVSISGDGMRTDRHNNPTAFTIDIAKQGGLVEGVDYEIGDPFPNNPNQKTARLLGDPVDQTIKVIDKIGFFTRSGNQRWTHTAMTKNQWNALSPEAKKQVIQQMYKKEGNQGLLNNFFV